jgi:hypothetical protein
MIEKYLVKTGQVEGNSSLVDKVNRHLKLAIHDVSDDNDFVSLTGKWSRFKNDYLNVVPKDQTNVIKAFVALNGRGSRVTQTQFYLCSKVNEYIADEMPTTLDEIVENFFIQLYTARTACRIAYSCGYRITVTPIGARDWYEEDRSDEPEPKRSKDSHPKSTSHGENYHK